MGPMGRGWWWGLLPFAAFGDGVRVFDGAAAGSEMAGEVRCADGEDDGGVIGVRRFDLAVRWARAIGHGRVPFSDAVWRAMCGCEMSSFTALRTTAYGSKEVTPPPLMVPPWNFSRGALHAHSALWGGRPAYATD